MDDQNITTEEYLEALPEEAKAFLYRGPFDDALAKIATEFLFSEEQKSVFAGIMIAYIAGTKDADETANRLDLLNLPPERKISLQQRIIDLIINPLLEYVESEEDDSETNSVENGLPSAEANHQQAPSPADMLARLSQTMTKPTMIAPVKRDYSAPTTSPTATTPAPIHSIDPYREAPEK